VAFFLLAFLPINYMHSSFSFHALYMLCPSHDSWHHHSNYTWRSVQVMKPLIMQLSTPSRRFISPHYKYYQENRVVTFNVLLSVFYSLTLCTILWKDKCEKGNGKTCERKLQWPNFETLSIHFPESLRKITKNLRLIGARLIFNSGTFRLQITSVGV
jgi:hypothetical protein